MSGSGQQKLRRPDLEPALHTLIFSAGRIRAFSDDQALRLRLWPLTFSSGGFASAHNSKNFI